MTHTKSRQKWYSLLITLLAVVLLSALCMSIPISHASSSNPEIGEMTLVAGNHFGTVLHIDYPYNSNVKMEFSINGRTMVVNAAPTDVGCAIAMPSVYPHELADTVQARLYDGSSLIKTFEFSMKETFLTWLSQLDTISQNVVSNILQYGHATQAYRNAILNNSSTDNLILGPDFDADGTVGFTPSDIENTWTGTPLDIGTSTGSIRISTIGVGYDAGNHYVMRIEMPTGTPFQTIRVIIDGVEYWLHDRGTLYSEENGITTYELKTYNIPSNAITKTIQVRLVNQGEVLQAFDYNVYSYALQMQELFAQSTDAANSMDIYLAMQYAKALYQYGVSCEPWSDIIPIGASVKSPPSATLTSSGKVSPTGGVITVYYSDGTSADRTPSLWAPVDTITDDSYSATRTTYAVYTENGETVYTNTYSFQLLNPITSIEVITDGSDYSPTTHTTAYRPRGVVVRYTRANGRTDTTSDNIVYSDVNMSSYATKEYAKIPFTFTFTKDGANLQGQAYFWYTNPIKAITPSGGSVTFNGSSTATATGVSYTVTLQNGQTKTITNASPYSVSTKLTYTDNATSGTATASTALSVAASGSQTFRSNGSTVTKSLSSRTITGAHSITFSNPYTSIAISTNPTITINSTAAPSSAGGQITGGALTVTLGNTETVSTTSNITWTTSAGISDATYSKNVTLTAQWQGLTASKTVAIYNNPKKFECTGTPSVYATASTNVSIALTHATWNGLFKLTYQNGFVQTGMNATGSLHGATFYIPNITDSSASKTYSTTYTSATLSNTPVNLVMYYYHSASGIELPSGVLSINVINDIVSQGTVPTKYFTATSASNTTLAAPTGTAPFVCRNGVTANVSMTWSAPANITTNAETASSTGTITATRNGQSISGTYNIMVVNPATSLSRYTDPSAYKVSNTSAITSSDIISNGAGQVVANLTNGTTKVVTPSSFTSLTSAKITDGTLYKQVAITAQYASPNPLGAQTCTGTVYIILYNQGKSAKAYLSAGDSASNRITLSTSAVKMQWGSAQITLTNGVTIYSSNNTNVKWSTGSNSVYPSGTRKSGTATTAEEGYCDVYCQAWLESATTTITPYANGTAGSAWVFPEWTSGSLTDYCYWKNPATSMLSASGGRATCIANATSGNVTPTGGTATVKLANGAQKSVTPTWAACSTCNSSDSIQYKTSTAYYTSPGGSQVSCSGEVGVLNPPVSMTYMFQDNVYSLGTTGGCTPANAWSVKRRNGLTQNNLGAWYMTAAWSGMCQEVEIGIPTDSSIEYETVYESNLFFYDLYNSEKGQTAQIDVYYNGYHADGQVQLVGKYYDTVCDTEITGYGLFTVENTPYVVSQSSWTSLSETQWINASAFGDSWEPEWYFHIDLTNGSLAKLREEGKYIAWCECNEANTGSLADERFTSLTTLTGIGTYNYAYMNQSTGNPTDSYVKNCSKACKYSAKNTDFTYNFSQMGKTYNMTWYKVFTPGNIPAVGSTNRYWDIDSIANSSTSGAGASTLTIGYSIDCTLMNGNVWSMKGSFQANNTTSSDTTAVFYQPTKILYGAYKSTSSADVSSPSTWTITSSLSSSTTTKQAMYSSGTLTSLWSNTSFSKYVAFVNFIWNEEWSDVTTNFALSEGPTTARLVKYSNAFYPKGWNSYNGQLTISGTEYSVTQFYKIRNGTTTVANY